jgi:hypothetical protein
VQGGLLRYSRISGEEKDKNKIQCKLCDAPISFSASSFTAAEKHVGTHGVTRDNVELAMAMVSKAEEEGNQFPMKEWKELAAGKVKGGERKVYTYMTQDPYTVGGTQWQETITAVAKWIAKDCMPLNIVESPGFRALCRSINGRCPAFSRKSVTRRVRVRVRNFREGVILACIRLLPLLTASVDCLC